MHLKQRGSPAPLTHWLSSEKERIASIEEALVECIVESYPETLSITQGVPVECLEAKTGLPAPLVDSAVKKHMKEKGLHRVKCGRRSKRGICISYKDYETAVYRISIYNKAFISKVLELNELIAGLSKCRKNKLGRTCKKSRSELRDMYLRLTVLLEELGVDWDKAVSKYRVRPEDLVTVNGEPYLVEDANIYH